MMMRRDLEPGPDPHDDERARLAAGRARLRARLAIEAESFARRERPLLSPLQWTAAAAVALVSAGASLLLPPRGPEPRLEMAAVEPDARPLASFTPGATIDMEMREVCTGLPRPREIDAPVRAVVLKNYGMEDVPPHEYELDYLITPELGGAPVARNLWPQRYRERLWNASVKDQLEDLLPRLVCEGSVDLHTAQRDIAVDWVAAYRKYFRTIVPLRPSTAVAGLSLPPALFTPEALFR